MAVGGPRTVVRCRQATDFSFAALPPVEARTIDDVNVLLGRLAAHGLTPCAIELLESPPEHVGLGSKTTLLLSVARVVAEVTGVDLTPDELCAITRRGGTSGIGIHTFFEGGWMVDGGRSRDGTTSLRPSSAQQPTSRPPAIAWASVPTTWRFHLLLPRGSRRSAAEEIEFFRTATPVPRDEVLETLSQVYHGIMPAVVEGDLGALHTALSRLRQSGFKRREIDHQSTAVRNLLDHLDASGYACGMSSLGPLVYVIVDDSESATRALISAVGAYSPHYLGSHAGINHGFRYEPESRESAT